MAHATLRPGCNITMIFIWGALACLMTIMSSPHPLTIVATGSILGLVLGIIQKKALQEAGKSICEAKTAMEVRAKLKETKWGKKYLYILWASAGVLGILWFLTSKQPLSLLASYFALMFVRELLTLKETFQLSRLTGESR